MRKILIAYTLLLISFHTQAQRGFGIGFLLNPELTKLYNKSDKHAGQELNYASSPSFLSAGLSFSYDLNKKMGVEVDIMFSREGQNYTGNMGGNMSNTDPKAYSSIVAIQAVLAGETINGDYKARSEPNYVKIPIMFKLSSNTKKPFFMSMHIGPQFNILESAAQEIDKEDHDYPGTNITPKDLYKKVAFAGVLALGGGYNFTSHLFLSADLRFDYGFSDIEAKSLVVNYLGQSVKFYSQDRATTHSATAGLMIGIHYRFK